MLGHNKINQNAVSQSKPFSGPSSIYNKISPNPVY